MRETHIQIMTILRILGVARFIHDRYDDSPFLLRDRLRRLFIQSHNRKLHKAIL